MTRADFDELLLPLYEPLQRRLLMIVRDTELARDLTQDAYANAWRAWHTFDGREPRAWLFRIGTRLALNHLRRGRVWQRIQAAVRQQPAFRPDVQLEVWEALGRLRPTERTALLLHTIDGYTYEEIGTMMGMKPGTVGSHISRASQRLRAHLGEPDG